MDTTDEMANDLLEGAAAIAKFLGMPVRRVEYLIERRNIPAFQIGRRWYLRRSTYQKFIEQLETGAIQAAAHNQAAA